MHSEKPVADRLLHWVSVAKLNVNKCLNQLSLEYAQVGIISIRRESFTSSRKSISTFEENPEAQHRFADLNFAKSGVE